MNLREFSARLERHARLFPGDRKGALAISFALAVPITAVAAGVTIEYANLTLQQTHLQQVADSAALASARELRMSNTVASTVTATALSNVNALLTGPAEQIATTRTTASLVNNNSSVKVVLEQDIPSYFGGLVTPTATHIRVTSVATMVGGAPICVLTLDRQRGDIGIRLTGSSKMTGNGCAVFSNANSSNGIDLTGSGTNITAAAVCSVGGLHVAGGSITPVGIPNCTPQNDPLASRGVPVNSGCSQIDFSVNSGTVTLLPGSYCGGITLSNATVTFSPGIYVIKNGDFTIRSGAIVTGTKVGFVLDNAQINITTNTGAINFGAPVTGPMAGILFAERNNADDKTHQIHSDNVQTLLGTIYLPQSRLLVGANARVAHMSAYTIIVSHQLELKNGPNLVLNSDYSATDVPVPQGVGPGAVALQN